MAVGRIRVVLVRPRQSGNVGAAARALKNMNLRELVLVAPWRFDPDRAAEMAVHAADVVSASRVVGTVADAVADCGLVVGTTSRTSAQRHGAVSPREMAPDILSAASSAPVALLFGPEDHGLSNEDLALCQRVVTIPTGPGYPSLNLGQAVLVCAYELFVASSTRAGERAGARGVSTPRAASSRLEFMYARLEEALLRIGFLHDGNATHMMRTLRRTLGRAALSDDEVQIFLGLARQMRWAGERALPGAG